MKRSTRNSVLNVLFQMAYKAINFVYKYHYRRGHQREIHNYRNAGLVVEPIDLQCEKEFIAKWDVLFNPVNVNFYRMYSKFVGNDPNIVSDDIFHCVIEPILNLQTANSLYADKNMYELLISPDLFPKCILRNIESEFLDRNYAHIDMTASKFDNSFLKNPQIIALKQFIIKPTIDTSSGSGVHLFKYDGAKWRNEEGDVLSYSYLMNSYSSNFIFQECIEPSSYNKNFNTDSFNTFRVVTYRSVMDEQVHLLGITMRMGAKGSFKDNVHAGGYIVEILEGGRVGNYVLDTNLLKYDTANGVNFKNNNFVIPNYHKIVELAFYIAKKMPLQRVLSFDLILDKNDEPRVIEINIKNQTVDVVQTFSSSFFGSYTNEVINYCVENKYKICYNVDFRGGGFRNSNL